MCDQNALGPLAQMAIGGELGAALGSSSAMNSRKDPGLAPFPPLAFVFSSAERRGLGDMIAKALPGGTFPNLGFTFLT